jgi:hypothetical protein
MNAESRPRSAPERRIYLAAAIAAVVLILIGFARTYYLKFLYDAPAIAPLVHLHGFVMTVWFGLFLVQVFLVSKRRVDLHRRLGMFGAVWAPVVFVVAVATAIGAAKAGHAPPGPPPLVFLAIPLGDMVFFAGVVPLAFLFRKKPAIHKRLMLLAFVGLLAAAIARIPLDAIAHAGPLAYFGLTTLIAAACIAADTIRNRRLHPAFGWGLLFLVATQVGRLAISQTEIWMRFATWVTQ